MNPINLLPQRERLWQRQRRWWRQRWSWTLGVSLTVWAGLAALLAWHHQYWVEANAQLQTHIEAQAPQRAKHERLLQAQRQWQDALQGAGRKQAALPEPWHSWQALTQMAAPHVHWERMVWDGQSISASGHVLQASVATQLQAQWQQRLGSGAVVEVLALKAEPTLDPQGVADNWWHWAWRWPTRAAVDNNHGAPSARVASPQTQPARPEAAGGQRP
jgi:hypothetical protein